MSEKEELTEWLQEATQYIKDQFESANKPTKAVVDAGGAPSSPEKRAADSEKTEAEATDADKPKRKKHFWFGEVDD